MLGPLLVCHRPAWVAQVPPWPVLGELVLAVFSFLAFGLTCVKTACLDPLSAVLGHNINVGMTFSFFPLSSPRGVAARLVSSLCLCLPGAISRSLGRVLGCFDHILGCLGLLGAAFSSKSGSVLSFAWACHGSMLDYYPG